jgi:hypothetical protein
VTSGGKVSQQSPHDHPHHRSKQATQNKHTNANTGRQGNLEKTKEIKEKERRAIPQAKEEQKGHRTQSLRATATTSKLHLRKLSRELRGSPSNRDYPKPRTGITELQQSYKLAGQDEC